MTPKKKPLLPRQEKLAKALASGLPLAKAAKKAGYSGEKTSACEIANKPNVSQRVTELREVAEERLEMSRLKALEIAWNRYAADHKDAKGYLDALLKAQGWNEPERVDISTDMVVNIRIGGKLIE